MACPVCGSVSFHVKNPEDQFDVRVFELRQGSLRPVDPEEDDCRLAENTELYCQRCAWHGKRSEFK